MRTFFDFDSKLKSTGATFHRYPNLSSLPFDAFKCHVDKNVDKQIEHYRALITRQLSSKFAIPALVRSDYGSLVNVDEALEGIPECYRHMRPAKSVLKLGLNISAQHNVSGELFAMRAGAIIAIFELAKKRGQQVQFDICYGYFGFSSSYRNETPLHLRIQLQTPTVPLIKIAMSSGFWNQMIHKVCEDIFHTGAGYRIYRIEETYPQFGKEFDFVLDRLETETAEIEYARILSQIEHLR